MKKVYRQITKQPIFFGILFVFLTFIFHNLFQFWHGEYSQSDLQEIKKSISSVEQEIKLIEKKNLELTLEKEKLSSGKEAIEGVARMELGMIKPNEKFYVFKQEVEESN